MRYLYSSGDYRLIDLAEMYGIAFQTVGDIINHKSWDIYENRFVVYGWKSLNVMLRDLWGEGVRSVGVGGSEYALLTMCEEWHKKGLPSSSV